MLPTSYMSNINGIPRIESNSVSVSSTSVVFALNSRLSFVRFNGLVLVKLAQTIPSGTTTTLPIIVTSANGDVPLVKVGGDAVTVADVTGTGVYLLYYDNASNTLQVLPAIV